FGYSDEIGNLCPSSSRSAKSFGDGEMGRFPFHITMSFVKWRPIPFLLEAATPSSFGKNQ
ncbi:TPA: hypothetical protein AB5A73_003449, partial [Vibrio cholerae]